MAKELYRPEEIQLARTRFRIASVGPAVFVFSMALLFFGWPMLIWRDGVAFTVCGALIFASFLRVLLLGLYVRPSGLTIRNAFRTARLPWSEIKRLVDGESLHHFDITPEYEGSWGLKVVPRQGRSIVATAVAWMNPPTKIHRLCAIAAQHGVPVTVRGFP